jgi:hypothetical protein
VIQGVDIGVDILGEIVDDQCLLAAGRNFKAFSELLNQNQEE